MREKVTPLTKEQASRTVMLEETRADLIEKALALTEAQAEYVTRRLLCLLQSGN